MCQPKDPGRRAIRVARRRAENEQSIQIGRLACSLVQWDTRIARRARCLAAPWEAEPEDPEMVAEATRTLVAEGWRFPPELAAWRARRGLSIPEAARPIIKPG